MARKVLFHLLLVALLLGLVSPAPALEKVKLGSSVRVASEFYLPVFAAEEQGFWKENGLDVEWTPTKGTVAQLRAVAAGSLKMGMSPPDGPMVAAEKGVPVIMVAEWLSRLPFNLYVKGDSPYRHPRDLKGARIGVTTLGGTTHIFGQIIIKAHGIEKDVRYIGAGGVRQAVAGIKVGAFEALVTSLGVAAELRVKGVVREIASTPDYVPKPWFDQSVFVRKDFARSRPDVIKKVLRALLQSSEFIRKNRRWALDKMKSYRRTSEEGGKLVYEAYKFTITGRLDRKAVENVRSVFIKYGLLTKDKAPAVDEFFTNKYLP